MADLLDSHGARVHWLVVRNLRDGDALATYSQSQSRRRLLELGAPEVELPCLAEVTRQRLQDANLTVGRGRTAEQLHLLDRSRCVRFQSRMAAEFAKARDLLVP
jgi:hypothetical protein